MKEGDLAVISYTGMLEDGTVFDTTDEKVAKSAGIYDASRKYAPVRVFVGVGELIKGLDEALIEMKPGEEKEVKIPPEKGFGERDPDKVILIPLREFKKRGINPYPGMPVEVDDRRGRVISISGGRVRVDLNHELAGKTLVYRVRVEEVVEDGEEKLKEAIKKTLGDGEGEIDGKKVVVRLPSGFALLPDYPSRRNAFLSLVMKVLDVEEVEIVEVFRRKKDDKVKSTKEEK